MSEDRTQREPLHPAADPARWEAAVGAIRAAAATELERRARAASPVLVLARWTRPVLSMAATVALLAAAAILSRTGSRADPETMAAEIEGDGTLAGVLMPETVSNWIVSGETESVATLVLALEEGR